MFHVKMNIKLIYVFIVALYGAYLGHTKSTSTSIPALLTKCYMGDRNVANLGIGPPSTLQLLIELIRKVELQSNLDMRLVATSLLHGVRFDGIEKATSSVPSPYVIPYRATAPQFTRYRFLVDYLTSGDSSLFPEEVITNTDLCLLHKIISSTVFAGERGDEARTCPVVRSMPYQESEYERLMIIKEGSTCPEESGVMKTKWGTVSPGHLVAAVASSLQMQEVRFAQLVSAIGFVPKTPNETRGETDDVVKQGDGEFETEWKPKPRTFQDETNEKNVSNIWVATLAGDLAEAALYQGPYSETITLGNFGHWNDTFLPRAYYLAQTKDRAWDMTSAELLGGIDGVVIANKIKEWTNKLRSTRLSQIIEMYYSERGVGFDRKYRACERRKLLEQVLIGADLHGQVSNTANLLHLMTSQTGAMLTEEVVDQISSAAFEKFNEIYPQVTDLYSGCEKGLDYVPRLEIVAVIDSSWTQYETSRVISALAEAADVSYYGSKLGVLNGNTGVWMTNVTNNLVELYQDLSKPDLVWPSSLSLSNSLESLARYYQNKSRQECLPAAGGSPPKPFAQVVLFLAPAASVATADAQRAVNLIQSIKDARPEISVAFVTSEFNAETYQQLTRNKYFNDFTIEAKNNIGQLVSDVVDRLAQIPSQMINFDCGRTDDLFEDYVTPGRQAKYQIHYNRLRDKNEIKVQFQDNDYGSITVCAYKDGNMNNKICNSISQGSVVEFKVRDFCTAETSCNVPFTVTMEESNFKCAELDCRYPDQGRIIIKSLWTYKNFATKNSFNALQFVFISILPISYSYF